MARGRDTKHIPDKSATNSYQVNAPNCPKVWPSEAQDAKFVDRVVKHRIQHRTSLYKVALKNQVLAKKLLKALKRLL